MGKKARERKLQKIEELVLEKQQIEDRRQQTKRPIVRRTIRLAVVSVITIALLFLGHSVNQKIAQLENNISSTQQ